MSSTAGQQADGERSVPPHHQEPPAKSAYDLATAGTPDADPPPEVPMEPDVGTPDAADGVAWADSPVPPPPGAEPAPGPEAAAPEFTVEDLVQDLERVTGERDQYLDASRRLQAEFENYRKAVAKREADARERANESLVAELLPVLDACDGALASGASDVEPVANALVEALTKPGLDRIDGQDEAFDPSLHDAVMHEPSDDGSGPVVAEVMRAGYRWRGRVVRPAMVRVRG
ncbi:MAG: nucleotide exchange factor GrpE [Actinomycetota bacterium]